MNRITDDEALAEHPKHTLPHYKVPVSAFTFAMLAALLFGVLYMALPETITIGPDWLPLAIEVIIIAPIVIARFTRRPIPYRYTRVLLLILLCVITLALIIGIALLIITLPQRQETQASSLLRTGALLYAGNILVFGLIYWEIDGGGPKARHERNNQAVDFLFPQQTDGNKSGWVPHLIDYLFLAFTSATAFSPTDTYPLTWRAKGLMMVESVLALTVLSILIGRAINIL
jgi:hypothetical protein